MGTRRYVGETPAAKVGKEAAASNAPPGRRNTFEPGEAPGVGGGAQPYPKGPRGVGPTGGPVGLTEEDRLNHAALDGEYCARCGQALRGASGSHSHLASMSRDDGKPNYDDDNWTANTFERMADEAEADGRDDDAEFLRSGAVHYRKLHAARMHAISLNNNGGVYRN
jgi:hypothetical protein